MSTRLKSTQETTTVYNARDSKEEERDDDESISNVSFFFRKTRIHSILYYCLFFFVRIRILRTKNVKAGASKRVLAAKQKKFNANIHKRGMVDINSSTKDKEKFTVGPVVLAFFIFVVIGSSLLQMIRTLQTGKP